MIHFVISLTVISHYNIKKAKKTFILITDSNGLSFIQSLQLHCSSVFSIQSQDYIDLHGRFLNLFADLLCSD